MSIFSITFLVLTNSYNTIVIIPEVGRCEAVYSLFPVETESGEDSAGSSSHKPQDHCIKERCELTHS